MNYTECIHVDGCANNARPGRFLCRKHNDSTKLDGTRDNYPMIKRPQPPRKKTPITKVCDVDGCDSLARSNVGTHCEMHESRLRITGTTDPSERQRFRNQALIGEDLKCTRCEVVKSVSQFSMRKGPTGNPLISRICKDCCKTYNEQRREFNRNRSDLWVGDKTCERCGDTKAKTEFDQNLQRGDGLNGDCKRCRKDIYLSKKYGIDLSEYEKMFADQDGLCFICQQPETSTAFNTGTLRMLAVDHCHTSGNVRKLLCSSCNVGLGYFKDDPRLLEIAANYLRNH